MDPIPLSFPLLMDGAMGTELRRRGMPTGVCTAEWALSHPDILLEVQASYVKAGAGVLVTPTLEANRAALESFGLSYRLEELNRELTDLTRQAAGNGVLVAGDLGPTSLGIPPYGEASFEELVALYADQAQILFQSGVDLFLVETTVTMAEARAALLGIRKVNKEIPIFVSCYCDEDGIMPGGTDVLACAIVMQGMGAAAFGLNCVSPQTAEEQLSRLHGYLDLPLIAVPSAGLPDQGVDGELFYPETPEEFAGRVPPLAAAGVRVFGGCCGTRPEHIRALKSALSRVDFSGLPSIERDPDVIPCASEKEARFITPDVDVGETIRCGPDLLEHILEAEELPVGALRIAVLEEDDLAIFTAEQYAIRDALCLWSDVPALMEGALRAYQGRAFYDGTADLDPQVLKRLSREYGLIVL